MKKKITGNKRKKQINYTSSKLIGSSNDTIKKMKRQLTEWNKIFAKHLAHATSIQKI